MNVRTKLIDLASSALVAALLGLSMTLVLTDSLRLSPSFLPVAALTVGCVLALTLVLLSKWSVLGALVLLGGGTAVFLLRGGEALAQVRAVASDILRALLVGEGSLSDHALVLTVLISLIAALIAFLMSRVSGGVYPALLLYLFVLMGAWFVEERLVPLYVVPGLVALAILYARSYRETAASVRALSIALIAALLAVALLPQGNLTWKPLADAAQKARDLFYDYFLFTDPRAVYSVASDGFQPLGEALGGPATPRPDDIMVVDTDRTVLLRGSIKRTYTGYSWVDNTVNSRFLMLDPTKKERLNNIFGVNRLSAFEGAVSREEFSVQMLSNGTSTLFVPNRLSSFSISLDLATYFNDSGEVFMARSVEPGDAYSFSAYVPDKPLSELVEEFARAADGTDADYARIRGEYMSIPTTVEDDVYWITQSAVQGKATPLEKALALQAYLSANYEYVMDMPFTPQGRDFVSYFLLQQGKGYCTYFASALAVMARMADMPSRYVEGYLVKADGDGPVTVTGGDAHAWVEIYFEGVGWVEFDPTPGSPTNESDPGEAPESFPHTPEPTPTPTPEPTQEPDPSPEPTEDPGQEEPSQEPEPEDTPTPEPESEDTPEPEDEPTPEPDPDDPPDEPEEEKKPRVLLWILLILALLVLAVALRLWATGPRHVASRLTDSGMRLMVWYRAALSALEMKGVCPEGGESPTDFAARVAKNSRTPEAIVNLAKLVERNRYGGGRCDNRTLITAEAACRKVISSLKPGEKARLYARRLLHGLGNYRQIP